MTPGSSTPIDDFLAGGDSVAGGERLQRIGEVLGVVGSLVAIGGLAFLVVVFRGARVDARAVERLVLLGGALACLGGAVELAGIASIQDVSWADAMTAAGGAAAMMRFGGGLLVVLGLFDSAILASGEPATGSDPWRPDVTAFFAMTGAAMAGLSFAFDGHTVSKGPRVIHALVDIVHVGAAGIWFGGLVALAVVAWRQRRSAQWMGALHRFSMLATAALVVVALAGATMALFVLDAPGDLTGTPWGRLLLIKTALVALAASIGGYNHWVIVPASASVDGSLGSRARLAITAEAAVLVAVAVVTGLLTTASTL